MTRTHDFKLRMGLMCAAVAALAFAATTLVVPQQALALHENDDILLGDFFQSDADTSNSIYASYDGKEMYRIAQAYKGAGDGKTYDQGGKGIHHAQYDPSIVAWNGKFWSLSGWNRHKDNKIWFTISYSTDLVHWTHPEGDALINGTHGVPVNVSPSSGADFDQVAAEWSVTSKGLYITVSCGYYGAFHGERSNDRMQVYTAKVTQLEADDPKDEDSSCPGYYWPNNLRFKCNTAQRLPFSAYDSANYIDGSIYQEGNNNYLVIKRDGLQNDLYVSTTMEANSWKLVKKDFAANGYEGSSIAKLNNTYFLYGDHVVGTDADGVKKFTSSKISSGWSGAQDPKFLTKYKGSSLPARHGTVITLKHGTAEWKVAKALLDKQLPTPKSSNLWKRLAGNTAIGTMKQVVNEGWNSSEYAIVATTNGYYDALSASGLAGLLKCPILMTASDKLTDTTSTLIKSKGVSKVIVVGGTSAVSANTFNQIKKLGVSVERVAGNTAIGTANKIYEYGKKVSGGWGSSAIVATASGFQDALSVAPYAYAKKAPIFLASGKPGTLTSGTTKALKNGGFKRTVIVGGTAAVASSVDKQVTGAKRLAGNTAYGTSRKIADFAISEGMTAAHVGVATGKSYYDALAGAALCGKNNSVLILADDNHATNIDNIVKPNKSKLAQWCYVFGGTSAVSIETWNAAVTAGGNK